MNPEANPQEKSSISDFILQKQNQIEQLKDQQHASQFLQNDSRKSNISPNEFQYLIQKTQDHKFIINKYISSQGEADIFEIHSFESNQPLKRILRIVENNDQSKKEPTQIQSENSHSQKSGEHKDVFELATLNNIYQLIILENQEIQSSSAMNEGLKNDTNNIKRDDSENGEDITILRKQVKASHTVISSKIQEEYSEEFMKDLIMKQKEQKKQMNDINYVRNFLQKGNRSSLISPEDFLEIVKVMYKSNLIILEYINSGGEADIFAIEELVGDKFLKRAMRIVKKFDEGFQEYEQIKKNRHHPFLLQYYDLLEVHIDGKTEKTFGLITIELCECSLSDELKLKNIYTSTEAINVALSLLCSFYELVSEGILHLDIKPGNVLKRKNGEYILSDYGLSKKSRPFSKTLDKKNLEGTYGYIAPEMIRDSQAQYDNLQILNEKLDVPQEYEEVEFNEIISHEVDLFSLGVTLYQVFKKVDDPLWKEMAISFLDEKMIIQDPLFRSSYKNLLPHFLMNMPFSTDFNFNPFRENLHTLFAVNQDSYEIVIHNCGFGLEMISNMKEYEVEGKKYLNVNLDWLDEFLKYEDEKEKEVQHFKIYVKDQDLNQFYQDSKKLLSTFKCSSSINKFLKITQKNKQKQSNNKVVHTQKKEIKIEGKKEESILNYFSDENEKYIINTILEMLDLKNISIDLSYRSSLKEDKQDILFEEESQQAKHIFNRNFQLVSIEQNQEKIEQQSKKYPQYCSLVVKYLETVKHKDIDQLKSYFSNHFEKTQGKTA